MLAAFEGRIPGDPVNNGTCLLELGDTGSIQQSQGKIHTALAVEYFFSVAIAPPDRLAAFKAVLPRMTVSRSPPPGPRALLPIRVTESHSSDIVDVNSEMDRK